MLRNVNINYKKYNYPDSCFLSGYTISIIIIMQHLQPELENFAVGKELKEREGKKMEQANESYVKIYLSSLSLVADSSHISLYAWLMDANYNVRKCCS